MKHLRRNEILGIDRILQVFNLMEDYEDKQMRSGVCIEVNDVRFNFISTFKGSSKMTI